MDDKLAAEMLADIASQGATITGNAAERQVIASSDNSELISFSSGAASIKRSLIKKFDLIMNTPKLLQGKHNTQIRCAICNNVISYPCWYYQIKYSVNRFHYFVCFDKLSKDRPSTSCRKVV